MIVKDLAGEIYELGKGRLKHVTLEYPDLRDLREIRLWGNRDNLPFGVEDHKTRWAQLKTSLNGRVIDDCWVGVPVENNSVGCRTFSPATFDKILKAAGVVRKTYKRKPAKKVAR